MAKARLIPAMLLANGRLVKGRSFCDHEDAGDPVSTAKIYNDQMADEIVVLDIRATPEGRAPDLVTLERIVERCFIPIAFGGGIKDVDAAAAVLRAGADKVIVNSGAVHRPGLIGELARQFGSQAVMVAIDFRSTPRGPQIAVECGSRVTDTHLVEWARRAAWEGAGEILLTSVDREGQRCGLDIKATRSVVDAVPVPVIAHGGIGSLDHFVEGLTACAAAAVAAGRVFQFADNNLIKVRRFIQSRGIDLRAA